MNSLLTICANALKGLGGPADPVASRTSPAEEARVGEQRNDVDAVEVEAESAGAIDGAIDGASLDQPEDEATEHALRLMDEALRRNDAAQRWLVAGDS